MDAVWFPDGCRMVPRRMPFGSSTHPFSFSQLTSELRYRIKIAFQLHGTKKGLKFGYFIENVYLCTE